MKQIVKLVAFIVIAFVAWSAYIAHVNKIERSDQGDPVRTVTAFMDAAAKASNLIWDEDRQQALKSDVDQWEKQADQLKMDDVKGDLKEYGLEQTSHLFREEKLAKATFTTLCFYQIESFSAEKTSGNENEAVVAVRFTPKSVLGLDKLISALGGPPSKGEHQPISAQFNLERRRRRWYIVEVHGELGSAINASGRLR